MTGTRTAQPRPGGDAGMWHAAPDPPVSDAPASTHAGTRRPTRWPKRLVAVLAGVVVLSLLGAGVASDLAVRSQLRQARASLGVERVRLASTLHELATVQSKLATTSTQRGTLQVALELATWQLSGAKTNLATATTNLSAQQSAITALDTCLGGVERALNQISVGNQSGAVTSLSAVAASCQSVQGGGTGGPVFPFDFPDPDVVRVGTSYFGYATNSATGNIQMIESTDLVHWQVLGDALSHLASWAQPGATWAPGVIALGGRYVLFYAADERTTGKECISVAVAGAPQGPFIDGTAAPLVCQLGLGGSIDPSPFVDATGTPYLTWRSQGAGGQPATIWSQQIAADGTTLAGTGPVALIHPTQGWEGGVVEGPDMVVSPAGGYDLLFSANNWNSAHYAIGVARCAGPTGPCTVAPEPLLASQATFVSPGGPTVFTDTQGALWMAFHAYLPSAVGYPHSRLLFLRQIAFNNGAPVVLSPG